MKEQYQNIFDTKKYSYPPEMNRLWPNMITIYLLKAVECHKGLDILVIVTQCPLAFNKHNEYNNKSIRRYNISGVERLDSAKIFCWEEMKKYFIYFHIHKGVLY